MRQIRRRVVFVCASVLLGMIGCHSSEEKARRQREAQDSAYGREVAALRTRYDPVVDWPEALKQKTFTIDVEPVLVRSDKRPEFFYAMLEDIRRQDDGMLLYFRTTPTEGEPTLELLLECPGCDLKRFEDSAKNIGDFALVARVTAAARSLDSSDNAPDYVVHGRLVDAQFVGDYALDKLLQPMKN
jgi:hypothetical protein